MKTDEDIEIIKNNGKYEFYMNPPKDMVDSMKAFIKDKKLQQVKNCSLTENAWFGLFRTLPRKTWKAIASAQPMKLERHQIFCISGKFYIKDAKVCTSY